MNHRLPDEPPSRARPFTPRSAPPAGDTDCYRQVHSDRHTSYGVRWCASMSDVIGGLRGALAGRSSLWITTPSPGTLHRTSFFEPAERELEPLALRVLDCSEESKTMEEVERVCRWAEEVNVGRDSVLVSIGGGVSSDIVTMAASLLRRGVAHIRIPTTLLGLVDAGIGVKGAVNFNQRKNSLGCFHAPDAVLLAPAFLETLPTRQMRSGLGEVLKAAMSVDAALFDSLERNGRAFQQDPLALGDDGARAIVWESALRMLEELGPNLYEKQTFERRMDFAHTFSPLLEMRATTS